MNRKQFRIPAQAYRTSLLAALETGPQAGCPTGSSPSAQPPGQDPCLLDDPAYSQAKRCLHDAQADQLSALLESFILGRQSLRRNATLYPMGDPAKYVYLLRSGTLKRCHYSRDGEEQILGFHSPGDLLGLDGLEGDRHRTAVIAVERVQACSVSIGALLRLASEIPMVDRYLTGMLLNQIRVDEKSALIRGKRSAEARIAMFLLNCPAVSQAGSSAVPFLYLPMSRAEIGKYLGLSLETISRGFLGLAKKSLIEAHRRRVRLLDTKGLAFVACE